MFGNTGRTLNISPLLFFFDVPKQPTAILSSMTEHRANDSSTVHPGGIGRARLVGLVVVFLWFLIGGIAHFVATDIEMRIVPPCVPWPRAVVLVSGAFELLGAAGPLSSPTRRMAGFGLFALTIMVTPAHIYMLQRPELFNVPYWVLVFRLPLQVALLALIAWSTAPPRSR